MNLILNKPEYFYEMENICRLFLPHERFTKNEESGDENKAECQFVHQEGCLIARCSLTLFGKAVTTDELVPCGGDEREEEISMARGLYQLFRQLTGITPKWGVLTGVRPVKLYSSLMEELHSEDAVREYMHQRLLLESDKIDLCRAAYHSEVQAVAGATGKEFSLYISIPFCPNRCSYCSFVSHSVEKTAKLVPAYVDLLCEELKEIAKVAKEQNLVLKSIYYGGGTPTQLSAQQLDQVMTAVEQHFDLSALVEHTVEGGRPDTITKEKLVVLKAHKVDRLSINPQTMHDHVLQTIGRRHSAAQVLDAYKMAREVGFDSINMDVIAGLPGDTFEGFCQTLDQLIALNPENLTVHTLSVKRSSFLTERGEIATVPDMNTVEKMLGYATKVLTENGYSPYYLYRQSKMLGNQENVGWSKKGKDCLYNIYMMNELHTVLAAGAGGVSRLKEPHGPQIERIFNYKYPYEYNERFSVIIERKQGIGRFYEQYPT